ncbi:MAG TPA: isoprenylcysteine carboxylmethyltransferase family protein [Vicinamibacteria bacterium]|jgi:protein-S-isoprenylcysteine O-methyltransferase Ste14|nr:isoprenylcysteine carboxylmethyltransferase family protein [Vicinamibacteria bacterium]
MAPRRDSENASGTRRSWALVGSLLFLVLAPGTVAGWIPFWLTGWRAGRPFLDASSIRFVGAVILLAGLASLLDSFARFALVGLGTPAPVSPPTRLVVSGQYRYLRNPMYVAVLAIVLGQGLVLASSVLLGYAAVLWILFHCFVVLYEERALAAQFGSGYEVYCRNVRRWWPRTKPWLG